MRILVVGIGNVWASDDAIGPTVVRRLKAEYPGGLGLSAGQRQRPSVTFETCSSPAVELLDLLGRCEVLIVVDAISSGAPPGTIHRQDWHPGLLNSRGIERASSHGLGVRELLGLGAKLGQLPDQVILWGIEIVYTGPGTELSPAVKSALPAIVSALRAELLSASLVADHC